MSDHIMTTQKSKRDRVLRLVKRLGVFSVNAYSERDKSLRKTCRRLCKEGLLVLSWRGKGQFHFRIAALKAERSALKAAKEGE